MEPLYYIDRKTKSVHQEQVEGGWSLSILYGRRWITKLVGKRLAKWIAHLPWVSKAYGLLQAAPWTRRKVRRFVKTHGIP
ncbi:MAG: hypothetical protein KDK40_04670, partial [Chlamydiia bacterium]|nr:hypothetical protein [Chlamydiia bacterium]